MKKILRSNVFMALFMVFMLPFTTWSAVHIVNVQNNFFSPSNINNVQIGDVIRWVWVSGVHTTTSTTIPVGAAPWDSPITSGSPTYEYTVTVAGSYNYVCTPHAGMGMVGSFTVSAGSTLSVSPSNQSVSAMAGSTMFTVTSNSSWTATSNQPWCTVTPSGTGNGTITANYSANPATTTRVATITVSVSGLPSETVTVTQAGAAATLSVAPSNQNVAATAGSTMFTVTSNSNWTASSNQTWCTVTSGGSGNGTITANYSENTSVTSRVATITVIASGAANQTVTVTQEGAAATLSVDPPNHNVSPMAGSVVFMVTSNTNWTAQSNSDWCVTNTEGTGNAELIADYTENETYEVRVAELVITVDGLPPQTVTVTQDASTVSVNNILAGSFQLFPNPAQQTINISFADNIGKEVQLTIAQMNGRIVMDTPLTTSKIRTIDISELPSGTYIISVISGDKSHRQILVKAR